MNKQEAFSYYASQLEGIRESGVLKAERIITTPQSAHIFADGKELLNMCANNYLGQAVTVCVVGGLGSLCQLPVVCQA